MFRSKRRAIVTPQAEHQTLVGVLALLWGNDEFDPPPIAQSSLVLGIGMHDRGYGCLDNRAIGEMSDEEWAEVARRGFYGQYSDIVADTIVKYHIRRLASYSDAAGRRAMAAEFSQAIDEQLSQNGLSKALFDRMDRLTALCDRISFDFCMDVPDAGSVAIYPRNSDDTEVLVRYSVDDGVIRVNPWPFAVTRWEGYLIAYHADGYPEKLDPVYLPYRLEQGA